MNRHLIFLLGGARSGKSYYAEHWARTHGESVLFVATAQAFDDEMHERIAQHQADRPAHWQTLEAPLDAAQAIDARLEAETFDIVLVDCLTLLASNRLLMLPDNSTQQEVNVAILDEITQLLHVYRQSSATWLIVSNEVGMGVVPPTRLGRFYRDALGRANQQVAEAADEVLLLIAGLPWSLKPSG